MDSEKHILVYKKNNIILVVCMDLIGHLYDHFSFRLDEKKCKCLSKLMAPKYNKVAQETLLFSFACYFFQRNREIVDARDYIHGAIRYSLLDMGGMLICRKTQCHAKDCHQR